MEWENVDIQEFIKKPKKVVDDRITEIKNYRINQGWTQKNMAEYLDIPLITYVQWENGTRTPPKYVLNLIMYKLKKDTEQREIPKGRTLYCAKITSRIHGISREYFDDIHECFDKIDFWNEQLGYEAEYEVYEKIN